MVSAPARIIHGDCLRVLRSLIDQGVRVDGVATDPPYHLASIVSRLGSADAAPIQSGASGVYARSSTGFMGQTWDGGDVAFRVETWRLVFEILKPGGHLIAFGASKNYHRMVCAIEDAGFEIRDMVPWLYGTGFPKSHDVATWFEKELCVKAVDEEVWRYISDGQPMATEPPFRSPDANDWWGWGTALKPAIEPVVLARKPVIGNIPENVRMFGVGALNIDGCRISIDAAEKFDGGGQSRNGVKPAVHNEGWRRPWMDNPDAVVAHRERLQASIVRARQLGRWPANICHDGSWEVLEAFAAFGERGADSPVFHRNVDKFSNIYNPFAGGSDENGATFRGDAGNADRFFYSSKASAGERIYECRTCGAHTIGKPPCGHDDLRSHPTVKPVDLMRWYVRMIVPRGGLVLDPFAGTGTTGAAARLEGIQSLLIEQDQDHCRDIAVRLGTPFEELAAAKVAPRAISHGDVGPLFGGAAA